MKNNIAKKILATTLAMSVLIGGTLTAFADDDPREITTTGSSNVTVTTKSGGSGGDGSDEEVFIVKIPASITLQRSQYTTFSATYNVGIKGVLPDSKTISVYPNGTSGVGPNDGCLFTMTGTNTSTAIQAEAVQTKTYWANQSVIDGLSDSSEYSVIDHANFVNVSGTITTNVTVADEYSGTLGFKVVTNNV